MEMDIWYDLYLRELVEPRDLAAEYVTRIRATRPSPPPLASDGDDVPPAKARWRRRFVHVLSAR